MSTRQLIERAVDLIKDHINDNIGPVLTALRTDRADPTISTETFVNYYISSVIDPFKTPCLFVIANAVDFQKQATNANYVNANIDLSITGVIEDRNTQILTRRIWRYMAAVQEVIEQVEILSDNGKIKVVIIPENAKFSEIYTKEVETKTFRQEFTINCSVNCFEQY